MLFSLRGGKHCSIRVNSCIKSGHSLANFDINKVDIKLIPLKVKFAEKFKQYTI